MRWLLLTLLLISGSAAHWLYSGTSDTGVANTAAPALSTTIQPQKPQVEVYHSESNPLGAAFFDHFLLIASEQDPQAAMASLLAHLRQQGFHPGEILRIQNLFSRLLNYKAGLAELDQNISSLASLEELWLKMEDRRRVTFSEEEYQQLFADEYQYNTHMLKRLQLARDETLTPEGKQTLLEHHMQTLPQAVQQAFKPSENLEQVSRLRAQSQDYEQAFPSEVADRLSALDNKRQVWREKVALFSDYQKEQLAREDIDAAQKQQNINEKLTAMFSHSEQKRVRVLTSLSD